MPNFIITNKFRYIFAFIIIWIFVCFCLKIQVSDIAWLPPSACFPKHNKNPIKIWSQWDSCFCLTWHGGATGMAGQSTLK